MKWQKNGGERHFTPEKTQISNVLFRVRFYAKTYFIVCN